MGTWTGAAGVARTIKDAAGIAAKCTAKEAAMQEYNRRSRIELSTRHDGMDVTTLERNTGERPPARIPGRWAVVQK